MRVDLKKFLDEDRAKTRVVRCASCKLPAAIRADLAELQKAGASLAQMTRYADAKTKVKLHGNSLKIHLESHV